MGACFVFYFIFNWIFFFRILQHFPCDIEDNCFKSIAELGRVKSSTSTYRVHKLSHNISTSHTTGSYRIGSLSLVFKS